MVWRRAAVMLVIAAVVVGMCGLPAAEAAIQDVYGTRFEGAVTYLNRLGVLEGRPQGFYPLEPITRAEATKIVVEITGQGALAAMLLGAPSFPDVGSSHWASGYIAVARNLRIVDGFPDGTFRPEDLVTYAQYAKMLVEAAGLQPTAGYAWPLNYIDPATKAGILKDTTFSADVPAIRGDCAIMTSTTVKDVRNPATGRTLGQSVFGEVYLATLDIFPASHTTMVGSAVDFAIAGKDAEGNPVSDVKVTYTTDKPSQSMISSTGRFVATHSGTYLITATAGQLSATASVTVYGTPAALRVSASPSSLVANGQATSTITVDIVDSNGVKVPNATNAVTIEHYTSNGAVVLPSATTENAKGGAATFVVTSTLLSDVTDTIRATATGLGSANCAIRTVEPKATSFTLKAVPEQLPANTAMTGYVTAEVLDQSGAPMKFGTYYLTFSISGKGYLEGGTGSLIVGTVDQKATVAITSWQGDPGTIRVTASASGLGSRSVSVATYMAGAPKSIRVTATDTSGEAGSVNDMTITVGLIDNNNRPAVIPALGDPIVVEFVQPDGAGLVGLGPVVFNPGDSFHVVEFYGTVTGTHRVTVRDVDTVSPAVSSTSFNCTVTSGQVHSIGISPDGTRQIYIPLTNPRVTVTAQLLDEFGNNVSKSGVRVQFTAPGSPSVSWSSSQGKVTTDSSGKATITMIGQGVVGHQYTVAVSADLNNDGVYGDLSTSTAAGCIEVTDRVPADFTVVFRNDQDQVITYLQADANKLATATIRVLDKNGNAIPSGTYDLQLVISNLGRHVVEDSMVLEVGSGLDSQGDGVYEFRTAANAEAAISFKAGLAGSYSWTVKCLNVVPVASKSFTFRTTAGTAAASAMILKTDNTPADDFSFLAGNVYGLRIGLVDNGGNPVAAPGATTLYLTPSAGGVYRLTSGGAPVTEVTLAKGTAMRSIYYINTVSGTADLTYDVTDYDAYDLTLTWDAVNSRVVATVRADDNSLVSGVSVRLTSLGAGTFGGNATVTGVTNSQGVFQASFAGAGPVEGSLVDARNLSGGTPQDVTDTLAIP